MLWQLLAQPLPPRGLLALVLWQLMVKSFSPQGLLALERPQLLALELRQILAQSFALLPGLLWRLNRFILPTQLIPHYLPRQASNLLPQLKVKLMARHLHRP